jgi:integrase
MIGALRRHRALLVSEQLIAREWFDRSPVFPNQRGAVQRSASLIRDLRRAFEAAGVMRIRFHDLRRIAATLMLRPGTAVVVVAKILGHRDPAITLRRYAHVLSDMQTYAAARMVALLS